MKRVFVAVGMGVVVIAGACKGGSTGPDVNAVTQLAVTPTSVAMASLGDTTVLTASPRSSTGALVSTVVSMFVANTPFQIKLAMIVIAASMASAIHKGLRREALAWDGAGRASVAARIEAAVSLAAIAFAIVAGRLIAYF
jgi:hypothetical protein